MSNPVDRRSFLGMGAGAAMFCALTPRDVQRADAAAVRLKAPPLSGVDKLSFPTPAPAPGGRVRRYWIQAETVRWSIAPHVARDEWMNMPIRGRKTFPAFVYRRYSEGFARPLGPAAMPGPLLVGEVGDLLEVHFRNAIDGQATTMHAHGVRYNPDYDGSYLSRFTRAGGFVAPGEQFTYRWECVPGSEGAWPYHDHGPNHTVNTMRGMFGALRVLPRGEAAPAHRFVLFQHAIPPGITGRDDNSQCFNGRVGAGNTPTLHARVGDDVEFLLFGTDSQFHTFHMHGHRWRDTAGAPEDNPGFGPHESRIARFREDNPGRWLYHCHVFSHQDAGMAGWYLVEP